MLVAWRLAALILGALSLGLSLAHLLGLPERLEWEPALWLAATAHGTRYSIADPAAALVDILAILSCAVLARLLRDDRTAIWSAAAAALFLANLIVWTLLVLPMSEIMAAWPAGRIPSDFEAVRNQWEGGQAVAAVVKLAAFATLVAGLLGGTRRSTSRCPAPRSAARRPFRRADDPSSGYSLAALAPDVLGVAPIARCEGEVRP